MASTTVRHVAFPHPCGSGLPAPAPHHNPLTPTMISKERSTRIAKGAFTLFLALMAALTLWHLYTYYTYSPQTRDAKLRADVVPLAADVSGRVDEVFASDNEEVRKGQVLFTIDKARLSNEVEQAAAAVATAAAQLHAAEREDKRYRTLSDVVSSQELDTRHSAAQEARARHAQALANRDRKSVVQGKRVSVRVDLGGRRLLKKKKH